MAEEAAQAPRAVRDLLKRNAAAARTLGADLRSRPLRAVLTCARGSSDHAATYAKYLIETRAGLFTASAAPSVSSVYEVSPEARDVLCLAISQSDASPDLVSTAAAAREAGAHLVALVNAPGSPLAASADAELPLWAGPELSVAATKSYLAALAAIAQLVAAWTEDAALGAALDGLPGLMEIARTLDWSAAEEALANAGSLYVVGRGPGFAPAQEAALKFKETCGLHAEAFSAAEIRHGPMALARDGFPVLIVAQDDASRPGVEALAAELAEAGAMVLLAGGTASGAVTLPTVRADPLLQPILLVQSFYGMVEALARRRGFRPGPAARARQGHEDGLMAVALVNGRMLNGRGFVDGMGVVLDGGRIVAVASETEALAQADSRFDLAGGCLAPGFVDTQVNGGGGVLFNDDLSVEAIEAIGAAHRRFGTTGFLPTLISEDLGAIDRALRAVETVIAAGIPGVLGVHVEGPFLNAARAGIHDKAKFRVLDERASTLLGSLKAGRTLVTLAPERTEPGAIRQLVRAGVVVAAGHTDADYDQMRAARAAGLSGFTHLFNAMSPMTSRAPGAVGAALEDPGSFCGVILDGRHVHPAVLRIALRCKPLDRFMLVTDAMPSVGLWGPASDLQNQRRGSCGQMLRNLMNRSRYAARTSSPWPSRDRHTTSTRS